MTVARCTAAFHTPYGDRRCDLEAGHGGVHIRNDGCGRPEYHWANTETSPDPSGAARRPEITDTQETAP
jgi:hypothetical protein